MRALFLLAFVTGCMGGAPREHAPEPPVAPAAPVVTPDAPTPVTTEPAAPEPAPAAPEPALVDPAAPAPVAPAAPAVALLASAPASLWACEKDSDCIVECDIPGNCCGAPCGCRTAVNRHVLAELKTQPWKKCTREEHHSQCPAVACAHEPATGARCSEGRCVAVTENFRDVYGLSSRVPEPALCVATVNSTLPGVTVDIPSPSCSMPVAAARAGQVLDYAIVVTEAPEKHVYDKVDAGGCKDPGASGLLFRQSVVKADDPDVAYGIFDTGLCAPGDRTSEVVVGTHPEKFTWKAVEWSGPSDFGNPEGAPFEPGRYEIRLVATGTVGGSPYRVEATLPITLVP